MEQDFCFSRFPVLSGLVLSGSFSLGFEYALERLEKLRTRRHPRTLRLEKFGQRSPRKSALATIARFAARGVPVTVLFSDLIGFTTLSETGEPEALVAQLNEYLSRMTSVVFSNGGPRWISSLETELMAVWGNVRSFGIAEDAKNCARAAPGNAARATKAQSKMARRGSYGVRHGYWYQSR